MITEIKIENFKSVADLTLPLGRFNVLIGSNGSGKSNILEAIAFGAAASADKLDNEFLGSRGIRATSAQLMKSAFPRSDISKPIHLAIKSEEDEWILNIEELNNSPILKWTVNNNNEDALTFSFESEDSIRLFITSVVDKTVFESPFFTSLDKKRQKAIENLSSLIETKLLENQNRSSILTNINTIPNTEIKKIAAKNKALSGFIIYSPEISSLRKFDEEGQIKPLGINGEGLFGILQIFYENYGIDTINEIRKYLHIIEWFDDFEAIFDKVSGRKSLVVKDKNIPDVSLNQTNVNEGFLFLLFYISLIISKETPTFFAIDNIEAALHPRLCEELIRNLVKLSKEHNKQIILTTHNPFVLDGLDLNDPEQKLFVVRRNTDGETIADNIDTPIKGVKLSEAWMRGYIGGQPETIE